MLQSLKSGATSEEDEWYFTNGNKKVEDEMEDNDDDQEEVDGHRFTTQVPVNIISINAAATGQTSVSTTDAVDGPCKMVSGIGIN